MDTTNQELSEIFPNEQEVWTSANAIHSDLLITRDLVYNPCRFTYSQPLEELQNAEYGAFLFHLNKLSIRFRVAKITPTKIGQFVTLWERIGDAPIQPYDITAPIDYYVISTRKGSHFGQFVFPRAVLSDHDILSIKGEGGKRAIRVYPPWDNPTSRQAQKTQLWQLKYFLEIPEELTIDIAHAQLLYSPNSKY